MGMARVGRAAADQRDQPQRRGGSPGPLHRTAGGDRGQRARRRARDARPGAVRAVADANDREEAVLLGRVARLYELLRTSVIAGCTGPEMFRKLGEELGVRLYLVDPETGTSMFGDGECTLFAPALMASYAAHGNAIPGVLRLSRPQAAPGEPAALAVEVPGDQPTALVAEPVGSQLPSLVLLHHIATGGALELAQLAAVQERQWRLDADLLGQLLDRRIDPRVAGPLIADAGLDLAAS